MHTLRMHDEAGQTQSVQVRPRFVVNSIPTLVRLVEDGKGLLMAPLWSVAEAIAAGRVQHLLSGYRFDAMDLHAVYVDRRYLPSKTRVFIDAIAEAVRREASLE